MTDIQILSEIESVKQGLTDSQKLFIVNDYDKQELLYDLTIDLDILQDVIQSLHEQLKTKNAK